MDFEYWLTLFIIGGIIAIIVIIRKCLLTTNDCNKVINKNKDFPPSTSDVLKAYERVVQIDSTDFKRKLPLDEIPDEQFIKNTIPEFNNNFTFVAENIATYWYIVNHSPKCINFDKKQKLYATALLDSAVYMASGKIGTEDLKIAVNTSQAGVISTNFIKPIMHEPIINLNPYPNRDVVNLAMQLEAMFFTIDIDLPSNEIIELVIENKESIISAVDKTLKSGKKGYYYDDAFEFSQMYLNDDDFIALINSYITTES